MAFNRDKALAAAAKYAAKGQHDRAAKEYAAVVENDQADIRSWLLLADALRQSGDTAGAMERFMHVAKHYTDAGEHQKALAVHRQVLQIDPNRLDVQAKVAALYKELGRVQDAIATYEFVAQAYFQAGQIAEGLEGFRMVAELDPGAVGKRLRLAELYSREGMVAQAVEHFRVAADKLFNDRRMDDYIRVAERLIYHREDDLPVLRSLARIYLSQGENRRALVKLNALLRHAPTDPEGLELLADTFVALGKQDKAVSVLQELAREQRKGGRKAKLLALRVLKKAIALGPENLEDLKKTAAEVEAEVAALPVDPKEREEDADLDVDVVEEEAAAAASAGASSDDLELDVEVEEVPSRPFASVGANLAPSAAEEPEDNVGDTTDKVLLEVRVYIKYKMYEHALGHLDSVFVRDPSNVAGLELQGSILEILQRNAEAADTYVRLAQLVAGRDTRLARDYVTRAQKLSPNHTKAEMVLEALETGGGLASDEAAPLVRGLDSGSSAGQAAPLNPGDSGAAELSGLRPQAVPTEDTSESGPLPAEQSEARAVEATPSVPENLAEKPGPEAPTEEAATPVEATPAAEAPVEPTERAPEVEPVAEAAPVEAAPAEVSAAKEPPVAEEAPAPTEAAPPLKTPLPGPLPRYGEKTPLPRAERTPLPTFKPPTTESGLQRLQRAEEAQAAEETETTAKAGEPAAEAGEPAAEERKPAPRKPMPTPRKPMPAPRKPTPAPRKPTDEVEELDAEEVEEVEAEVIEEAPVEKTPPPARRPEPPGPRKAPPSRPPPKPLPRPPSQSVSEDSKSEARPSVSEDSKSEARPSVSEDSKSEARPSVSEDSKSEARLPAQPVSEDSKSEARPEAAAEAQPEVVAEAPVEAKPEVVAEAPAEAKPEIAAEAPAEAQPETVAEAPAEQPAEVAEAPVEAKPEPAAEAVEAKPEVAEAQPEPAAEAKPEVAAEAPAAKPEPAPKKLPARRPVLAPIRAHGPDTALEGLESLEAVSEDSSTPAPAEQPAEPAPAAAAASSTPDAPPREWPNINDEIEEMQFFLDSKFEDDAQFAFLELQRRYPGHPALAPYADRFSTGAVLESAAAPVSIEDVPAPVKRSSSIPESGPVLKIERLEDEDEDDFLSAIFDEPAAPTPAPSRKSGSQRAVASLDANTDAQTLFDLGMAYHEMGLIDDAIAQFELAARDGRWNSRAKVMIADLRILRGEPSRALEALNEAITAANDEDERDAARYRMAEVHLTLGDNAAAAAALREVPEGYRDREALLEQLGK